MSYISRLLLGLLLFLILIFIKQTCFSSPVFAKHYAIYAYSDMGIKFQIGHLERSAANQLIVDYNDLACRQYQNFIGFSKVVCDICLRFEQKNSFTINVHDDELPNMSDWSVAVSGSSLKSKTMIISTGLEYEKISNVVFGSRRDVAVNIWPHHILRIMFSSAHETLLEQTYKKKPQSEYVALILPFMQPPSGVVVSHNERLSSVGEKWLLYEANPPLGGSKSSTAYYLSADYSYWERIELGYMGDPDKVEFVALQGEKQEKEEAGIKLSTARGASADTAACQEPAGSGSDLMKKSSTGSASLFELLATTSKAAAHACHFFQAITAITAKQMYSTSYLAFPCQIISENLSIVYYLAQWWLQDASSHPACHQSDD